MNELGSKIRYAMVMLGNAVVDIDAGNYPPEQREVLARGLDQLAASLRAPDPDEQVVEGVCYPPHPGAD
ncbi:hypothetical protein [Actinopolyspora saharensis]|uniref:Uncharacterized protein n=1 Tax=Actinopolyspora saharensis TaxID=995062 RepID=A0A1H1ET42_9ACTN|nr:hypothetical protein [Actinopolyspora saharensis]SDQ91780.1 hypothetical protein SAMN04489718_2674 [Actinopolyspora saharensis]